MRIVPHPLDQIGRQVGVPAHVAIERAPAKQLAVGAMLAHEIARRHRDHLPPNDGSNAMKAMLKHVNGAADIDCIGRSARW